MIQNDESLKSKSYIKNTLVLSTIDFFVQLPNFFIILFTAIISNSSIIWVDLVNSFSNTIKNIIILSAFYNLSKNTNEKFNYGTGKYETYFSMLSSFVQVFSFFAVIFVCFNQIRFPSRPSENLLYAIFIKIINLVYDFTFLTIIRDNSSKTKSQLINNQDGNFYQLFIFDLVAFIIICLSYFFRDYYMFWYISPIVSLILSSYFMISTIKTINKSYEILTDKSISEAEQLLIMKVLAKYFDEYEELISISSHYDGIKPVIKLVFKMKEGTKDYQMSRFNIDISKSLHEYLPDANIDINFNPII